ncbi:hypothetical protein AcV7_008147 [Taiwanofungus camphoratus]|nr:hypothetical protein AcV7_008147 [Antrodia cinnamomea]
MLAGQTSEPPNRDADLHMNTQSRAKPVSHLRPRRASFFNVSEGFSPIPSPGMSYCSWLRGRSCPPVDRRCIPPSRFTFLYVLMRTEAPHLNYASRSGDGPNPSTPRSYAVLLRSLEQRDQLCSTGFVAGNPCFRGSQGPRS